MEFHLMSQTFQYNELNVIKIGFYISLTLNSFFELIYSLSLVIENSYVKYGYTSHILALLAIVVAFSTSIYQWCSILFRSHERKKYIFLLKIFLGINVICSMISVGVLCKSPNSFLLILLPSNSSSSPSDYAGSVVEFAENNNWAYVLFSAVNAYSLFFLTVSLLVYGRVLAKRFIVDSRDATFRRKYQSLLRINAILGICCFCFFTRVMCLGIAISDSQGTDIEEEYFRPIWWFLLNSWIPTIPVCFSTSPSFHLISSLVCSSFLSSLDPNIRHGPFSTLGEVRDHSQINERCMDLMLNQLARWHSAQLMTSTLRCTHLISYQISRVRVLILIPLQEQLRAILAKRRKQ
jgi:hypothetical protein